MRVRALILAPSLLAVAGAFAAVSTWSASALAEEPKSADLILVVENGSWDVDPEAVRAAIARETGGGVTLADAAPEGRRALFLRVETGRRATLSYRAEDGRLIGRTIELPSDAHRAEETIALLAGNLARDEAAELAAALGKRPGDAPPAAPSAEAQPPPTSPAPPADAPSEPVKPAPVQPEAAKPTPSKPKTAKPVAAKPAPAKPAPPTCAHAGAPFVPVGVDVVPFVGTSTVTGVNVVRRFSFNLFGGYNAGLYGAELSSGVNIESAFMCGVQIAGFANIVAGPVRGAQVSGGVNYGASLAGAQFGLANIAAGPVKGAQFGLVGVAGPVLGAQFGLANIAAGPVKGAQFGLLEIAAGPLMGGQFGLANIATGDTTGVQIGLTNISSGKVKGAQIGLINYANESSLSLGLLNIIPSGRFHLDLWGMESGLVMAGVKHGSDYFHNIYGMGARLTGDHPRLSFTLGLGGHLPLSKRFFLDVDALGYTLHDDDVITLLAAMTQARVVFGARLARRFAIYGGPTYNVVFAVRPQDADLSPYGSTLLKQDAETTIRAWPGAVIGVQAF